MVWIDTDMGFDDMLAILMVAQSDIPIAGISLVFGNAVLPQVTENAARAAQFFGWDFPFFEGANCAADGSVTTAEHVLGPTGIPTLGRALPVASPLEMSPALPALGAWLETNDEPKDILALGPLTNIAALVSARPDLVGKIQHLIWMGGGATTGNHTPWAEFNAVADPDAVATVLASSIELRMVDLDVCRQVLVAPDDITPLQAAGSDRALLLHDLYGGFVNIAISSNRPAMALYDPVTAAAIVDPTSISFAPVEISIELDEPAKRGRTIIKHTSDQSSTTAIGDQVDAERIKSMALNALLRAAA